MGSRTLSLGLFTFLVIARIGAQAADFAIESEVFQDNATKPFATNLTIFWKGDIYDFALRPEDRVTVFEGEAKRFLMADKRQRTQASLKMDELIRFVAAEQEMATRSKFELIRFAASPEFETSFDEKTGRLSLSSKHWDYRVETTPIMDDPNP